MTYFKILFSIIIMAGLVSCATEKKISTLDPKVENTLTSYEAELNRYEQREADLLSPTHFKNAKEFHQSAKKSAYRGKSFDSIRATVDKGRQELKKIDKNMELAKIHLKETLIARNEAIEERATRLEIFKDAEKKLAELAQEIEEKDINEVIESRDSTQKMYVQAEILAIKNRELNAAKDFVQKSNEMEIASLFERENKEVKKNIESAEVLIERFKDKEERYRGAVSKAEKSAERLFVLSKTANWIESKNPREVALKIDSDMNGVLKPFSYNDVKLMSYEEKVVHATAEANTVPVLLNKLTSVQYDSYMQERNLRQLKQKNQKMSDKLAVQDQIDKIRKMFSEDEAIIFVQGDDLTIRLVGLNFAFDKAKLPSDSDNLLNKVAESAKQLDYPDMQIIGHADAKGNALYNQKLSTKRAKNVNRYLVTNSKISKETTYISGAGFQEPVSDNKSDSGRKTNRRIDVVFNSVIK